MRSDDYSTTTNNCRMLSIMLTNRCSPRLHMQHMLLPIMYSELNLEVNLEVPEQSGVTDPACD